METAENPIHSTGQVNNVLSYRLTIHVYDIHMLECYDIFCGCHERNDHRLFLAVHCQIYTCYLMFVVDSDFFGTICHMVFKPDPYVCIGAYCLQCMSVLDCSEEYFVLFIGHDGC